MTNCEYLSVLIKTIFRFLCVISQQLYQGNWEFLRLEIYRLESTFAMEVRVKVLKKNVLVPEL